MAIKVQWEANGPFAVCDTATEAAELLNQARYLGNGVHATRPTSVTNSQPVEDRVSDVFGLLNEKCKRFLSELANHPDGIEGQPFSEATKIEVSGFGGIMGAISKAAQKHKFKLGDFVRSETRFEGQRRYRWLAPGKLLAEHRSRLD